MGGWGDRQFWGVAALERAPCGTGRGARHPQPTRQTTPLPPPTRDIIHITTCAPLSPMPGTNTKLTTAVENYFADLRRIRASGGSTPELSYYPPLTNLLNAVGSTLKPKVFCVSQMPQLSQATPLRRAALRP